MNLALVAFLYAVALAVEIYAGAAGHTALQYFSKPSLMLILLVYYFSRTRGLDPAKNLIFAALGLSWLGDVLLLADKNAGGFFLYGLVAFLGAHLAYIAYFVRARRLNRVAGWPHPLALIGVVAYTAGLFNYLAPHVGPMFYPVAVYALVIATMFAACLAAFDLGRHDFGRLAVAGALLFLVSDSVLAVNRFAAPHPAAPALVMLTYAAAQFLLTEGSLRNLRALEE